MMLPGSVFSVSHFMSCFAAGQRGGPKCSCRQHHPGRALEAHLRPSHNARINVHSSLQLFMKTGLRALLSLVPPCCFFLLSQCCFLFFKKFTKTFRDTCAGSSPKCQFCFPFGGYCSEDQMPGYSLRILGHICTQDRAVTCSVDTCFLLPHYCAAALRAHGPGKWLHFRP